MKLEYEIKIFSLNNGQIYNQESKNNLHT